MKSKFLLTLIIASLLCCLIDLDIIAQTPNQDDDVIRVETDVTNLPFTANDKNNRFITTLEQSDIRVLEDGLPQQLFTFQRETDRPSCNCLHRRSRSPQTYTSSCRSHPSCRSTPCATTTTPTSTR